jgi:hypothetical protein
MYENLLNNLVMSNTTETKIPLGLTEAVELNDAKIISAEKVKDSDGDGDGETWKVNEGRIIYKVEQEYSGNQGDPIQTENFDTLEEAEAELQSLTVPEEWKTSTTEHYALIKKVTQERTVTYSRYGDDWSLDEDRVKWNNEDFEDTGITKSFGTREGDTSDLLHECHFNLVQDISGEYETGGIEVKVQGRPDHSGYTGKYSSLSIWDKDENDLGDIELRISDHSYNPRNNAGKSWDGFISVVIANEDETKERFSGSYNLYFDGDNSYEDIVEQVKERIQEIIDGIDMEERINRQEGRLNPLITINQ